MRRGPICRRTGIGKDEFITRVLGAIDNPRIIAALASAAHDGSPRDRMTMRVQNYQKHLSEPATP
jgi:hypothetical protein